MVRPSHEQLVMSVVGESEVVNIDHVREGMRRLKYRPSIHKVANILKCYGYRRRNDCEYTRCRE